MNRYVKLVIWIALCVCAPLFAKEIKTVPVNEEPHHHQVLENDFIRMFDVMVPPHEATLMHRHDRDYIFITLGDSSVSNERMNETPVTLELKDGSTRFSKGGFSHIARNLSDTPFHNLTIELKNPGSPVCGVDPAVPCKPADSSGMLQELISTEHVIVRVTSLKPGEETPIHTHRHSHLAVALDDLTFENHVEGKPAKTLSMKKGEWVWASEAGIKHSLKNIGAASARMLVLEAGQ